MLAAWRKGKDDPPGGRSVWPDKAILQNLCRLSSKTLIKSAVGLSWNQEGSGEIIVMNGAWFYRSLSNFIFQERVLPEILDIKKNIGKVEKTNNLTERGEP
jgi:hypothetical protein